MRQYLILKTQYGQKNPRWPPIYFAKGLYIDNKIKNNTFKYMKAMKTTSFG